MWRKLDPFSLQFRLTVGVTLFSILGVSGVAAWTALQTRQILVASHKQWITDVAARFPQDVELYSDMMSTQTAMQKAIDVRTLPGLFIAIEDNNGTLLAHTPVSQDDELLLASIANPDLSQPEVYSIDRRYFVACSGALVVGEAELGRLYVAQDITKDQMMFLSVIRSLAIASLLACLGVTIAIAVYVQRSLRPLRRMGQLAETIAAEDLGNVKLQLEQAPSEIAELAHTYESMLMRISETWEQQRRFVNDVSHELRTPLTVVSGYLHSTLRRCNTLSEPQREALEIAATEADRTIQLLQDMLDLARADSGHFRFTLESLSLNDLAIEVSGMAEKYSHRAILVEAAQSNIWIKADRNRLKQVLLNLIDNALKYSDPEHPILLKLGQAEDQATIQVCDRGCGIPLQHQTRIFDRFYRVDETRTRATGGCGLGLSIVKTLVEGMGGTVAVYSKPCEGSTFTVTLSSPTVKP